MKVTLSSPQVLGGKSYRAGSVVVPDRVAYTRLFKQLVKAGSIKIAPHTPATLQLQKVKDANAVAKALKASKDHKAKVASTKSAVLAEKFAAAQALKKTQG
jgi:hypothetical protein